MLLQTLGYDSVWLYSISVVVMITMITAVFSCLCCRRKQEIKDRDDLLGLEGMVKLTNHEDSLANPALTGLMSNPSVAGSGMLATTTSSVAADSRPAIAGGVVGSDTEGSSKRTTNAPHRSLPDIPIAEPTGDNNSELYATVGDKVQDLPQGRSPTASLKKQTSVSQHSSISQADDISSPYARVRSPPHAYDKLRRMEHPYAQVAQPGNSTGGGAGDAGPSGLTSRTKIRDADEEDDEEEDEDKLMSPISRRESTQNLEHRESSTVDIPAASAIAGRVSASQDLPYMTPPIVQSSAQHFSGDSQDSSKGYTSISVREPLANLLPQNLPDQTTTKRRQMLGDSHYATVSDDSDEMYAAIDDPNNQGDLYTSGSETYAQIQHPNAVMVSVEINTGASSRPQAALIQPVNAATSSSSSGADTLGDGSGKVSSDRAHPGAVALNRLSNHSNAATSGDEHANLPSATTVEGGLRAQSFVQHSRQASSSSCTSSVGNLGSPKPEKRQANSPLPPTPKTLKHQANNFFSNSNQSMIGVSSATSSSSTTVGSGRNSASSVIEHGAAAGATAAAMAPREAVASKPVSDGDGGTVPNGTVVSGNRQKKSPSKDLEGMYAKVMKKNKLSKIPSQNSSPVALRRDGPFSECDMTQQNGLAISRHTGGDSTKQVPHRNSATMYSSKDPGYETIPGDSVKGSACGPEQHVRKSADYAQIQKLHRSMAPVASGVGGNNVGIGARPLSAAVAQADSEPGYESLPDTRAVTNDPGYETLNRGAQRTVESDSDPNYEILRPAAGKIHAPSSPTSRLAGSAEASRANDGYSSIREPGRFAPAIKGSARNRLSFGEGGTRSEEDDADSTPGYSSIKEKEDYDPGYSVISERKKPPVGHDYASITEDVKKRKPNINNNLEPDDESNIYASIPHPCTTVTLPSAMTSAASVLPSNPCTAANDTVEECVPNYSTIPERPNLGNTCTTLSSSPGYSSISETRTTPSSTDGDGSTSSPDQLISYNKHNNTNTTVTTTNSLSRISSNYESLTGSESDPNYESVKYLNVTENPYERLHNEAVATADKGNGTKFDVLPTSNTNESLTTDSDTATPTPNIGVGAPIPSVRPVGTPDSDGATTAVSDYFQV